MVAASAVEIRAVDKFYGPFHALKKIDLAIPPGKVTCLIECFASQRSRAWFTPDIEVYHHARGPAQNLEVLSYGFDPRTQMNWPLEWTVRYGQGRVYTSTFGHVWAGDTQPARMRCAGVQTVVVRALQWLAGRDVTWPVPADFPSATAASIRGEIPLPADR